MFFYMPAKVYCENNCVHAHARELASFGKKALIVTGKSSAFKNGSIADVQAALSDHGVECSVFNEVEENPSVETVMRGRDKGLADGADFVIGIGGGSPIAALSRTRFLSSASLRPAEQAPKSRQSPSCPAPACAPRVPSPTRFSRSFRSLTANICSPLPEESLSTHPSTPSPICMRAISIPKRPTAAACV